MTRSLSFQIKHELGVGMMSMRTQPALFHHFNCESCCWHWRASWNEATNQFEIKVRPGQLRWRESSSHRTSTMHKNFHWFLINGRRNFLFCSQSRSYSCRAGVGHWRQRARRILFISIYTIPLSLARSLARHTKRAELSRAELPESEIIILHDSFKNSHICWLQPPRIANERAL